MLRKSLVCCLMAISTVALLACEDPIVGEWKTDDRINCGRRGKMTIESDLKGEGYIPIPLQDCSFNCEFKVKATDADSSEYDYDIDIEIKSQDICTIDEKLEAQFECQLEDDVLDCGWFYVWKRKDG